MFGKSTLNDMEQLPIMDLIDQIPTVIGMFGLNGKWPYNKYFRIAKCISRFHTYSSAESENARSKITNDT